MIDVTQQIDAVHRTVARGTGDGAAELRTMTMRRTYEASAEDVWDACTDPERIARWFLPVSGDLRVGGRFQLEGHAGGTITACDPPRRFEATWESMGAVSWIAVSVDADGDVADRATFTLAHTVPVDDHWTQFGPGAVGVGWDMAVGMGLSAFLASGGETVDRAAVEAWTTSDDGRQFVIRSSDAWRDAHLAAALGPVEEAVGQGDRTAAAYTGTEG